MMKKSRINGVTYEYDEGDFAYGKRVRVNSYILSSKKYRVEWMFDSKEAMFEKVLDGIIEEGIPMASAN